MLVRCPKCSAILSTTSQQPLGQELLTCRCGQDLSELGGRPKTMFEKFAAQLRVRFRHGFVGAVLGAVVSAFIIRRIIFAKKNPWNDPTIWLALVAGPAIGFVLAAILGDRLLDRVDDLLK